MILNVYIYQPHGNGDATVCHTRCGVELIVISGAIEDNLRVYY